MSRIKCPRCGYSGSKIKSNGFTASGSKRWLCKRCHKSWSKLRRQHQLKRYCQQDLFHKWLLGATIRGLESSEGISRSHIHRILISELTRDVGWGEALRSCKYAALDGKFLFGRRYTVLILFNTAINKPVASRLMRSENRQEITSFLLELKDQGFNPIAITTDGKGVIAKCCQDVFPGIYAQRCLFHIILQVNAWVRIPPRTNLGRELHNLVAGLIFIETKKEAIVFLNSYEAIKQHYSAEIKRLKEQGRTNRQAYDVTKCFTLLDNAKVDMFRFLKDKHIAKTTSGLEGFNKQIQKIKDFDHNGLTKEHLDRFIAHYIALKNTLT